MKKILLVSSLLLLFMLSSAKVFAQDSVLFLPLLRGNNDIIIASEAPCPHSDNNQ